MIRVPSIAVGAVKVPSLAIVPFDAAQVTAVLLVPLTVALNRCCAPGARVTLLGETETCACVDGFMVWAGFIEPQPTPMVSNAQENATMARRWMLYANVRWTHEKLGATPCEAKDITLDSEVKS